MVDAYRVHARLAESLGDGKLLDAGLLSLRGKFLFSYHRLLFFHLLKGVPVYVAARWIRPEEPTHKELKPRGASCPVPFNHDILLSNPRQVWLCEGAIDTLSTLQMGIPAMGVSGVNGFNMQWLPLFKNVPKTVIAFDNDAAGQEAALRVRREFQVLKLNCEIFTPPLTTKDMNDLLLISQRGQRV
jgi:DNA primase